jgi:hypothetical protein
MSGYCLTVSARDLARAFHLLTKFEKSSTRAELTFATDVLAIRVGGTMEEMPACGSWPAAPVIIRARTGAVLRRVPLTGNSITLRVSDGKLYANTFGVPCEIGQSDLREEDNYEVRIEKAAGLLARFRVTRQQVEELAMQGRPDNAALWQAADLEMFSKVSQVWELLAPLGVEGCDIRRLINDSTRSAFTGPAAGGLK